MPSGMMSLCLLIISVDISVNIWDTTSSRKEMDSFKGALEPGLEQWRDILCGISEHFLVGVGVYFVLIYL